MGFGGVSIWQLLIVLVIVLLLFGSKKLRGIGSDLGNAVKGFRGVMSEAEKEASNLQNQEENDSRVINSKASGELASKDAYKV